MTPEQFETYSRQGYNRIPIARQVLADLDTPLSAYLKLADAPYTYLFESVQGGEKWGRYSIIGLPCHTVVKVYGNAITLEQGGQIQATLTVENPLAWIEDFSGQFKTPEIQGFPRFTGGLVGYFGYETMAYIEPRLKTDKPDPIGNPDILLMVSEDVLVFDNLSGKLLIVTHANPAEADAYTKAEEFKRDKIAVNALWPRTVIDTAALQMIPGIDASAGRTPAILADAAYIIFNRPSSECTGNFFVDDEVLASEGITDLEKYSVTPGTKDFLLDFFLE